ncbi:hypothetical protein VST7929_03282 [Vibrio stylophorae]|uniref:Agglutination protein n=1 Tax=Vibrio stylophorae TaxID=659351 RepID=A0ABM8ZZ96_9VIBR|nr:TolC family outer membrane protein [Vibrio stylophorae]CAH0535808.1 hypothetical protein VST7929_03282 [Vibrio stylophorae]
MKNLFIPAVMVVISWAAQAQAQSLEQAVAASLTSHPDLKEAFSEFKSREAEIDVVQGDYLPSVDLEAGIGYEYVDNDATSQPGRSKDFDRRDARVTLRQLIWDGSRTIYNLDRTEAEAEAQRYQLLVSAEDTALRVVEVYLNFLEAYDVLKLSEDNVRIHKEIYKNIEKRANSGIGSTADLAQAEARIANALSNLLAAQNNLQDAQAEFIRVVNQYPSGLVNPSVDQDWIPLSLDEATQRARENHPVLQVAENDVMAAYAQHNMSKSAFYPTFTVEVSQLWEDDANGVEGENDEFSAMLRMRYNLLNGGSDRAESRRTAHQVNAAKAIRENSVRQLDEGTRLAWQAMELVMQQKTFLQEHVDASTDAVDAYKKQFRIGKRTLLDLLNTENELFEARKQYITAEYQEVYAQYRVIHATGLLLDALRVDMPSQWLEPIED